MQLVLSNNRIIAHGENFLPMDGVVINTETGARYENATVAECDGCPSDIDTTGYEYHAGEFVPCAPFGMGNNNGYFMEVCESCATPRNSGIPIKGGLGYENFNEKTQNRLNSSIITKIWENASSTSYFADQSITLASDDWNFLIIEQNSGPATVVTSGTSELFARNTNASTITICVRSVTINSKTNLTFHSSTSTAYCIPLRIYGVKL